MGLIIVIQILFDRRIELTMKKTIKKTWMIASALTIGMAVLTPLQAGAASAEKNN